MKNYIIAGLICLVAALVIGVKPVQHTVNQTLYSGTLRGAETCMGYSKSEILSKDAVKAACVQYFQVPLFIPELAFGQAGPRSVQGALHWGGTLENKTPNYVTTWIRIAVTSFDADGKKLESFAETPVWIDPLGKTEFEVELGDFDSENFLGVKFCEKEDETPTECVAWGITDVRGLAI